MSLSVAASFENLVRRILESNRYSLRSASSGYDFDAKTDGDEWAIEIKFYRTARQQAALISAAAVNLANSVNETGRQALLIVSCAVDLRLRQTIQHGLDVRIYDRSDLGQLASASPELLDELTTLLEVSPNATLASEHDSGALDSPRAEPRQRDVPQREIPLGSLLTAELESLPPGKGFWPKHEQLCVRILEYLFSGSLTGWHKQKRTDDGLNRFDMVCRIASTTSFWSFLTSQLNSRYILFEFKNHKERITQGEILTTEKYLLERGLRRTALVLTRSGSSDSAIKAAQGAMREHGKLILVVDDRAIAKMLTMRQGGEDPTDHLFELADEFLISLPR